MTLLIAVNSPGLVLSESAGAGNSQNLGLDPQTFASENIGGGIGGGEISISGNALFADSGLDGSTLNTARAQSDLISIYVVRPGDTLSEIAEMFGVSAQTIIWANGLSSAGTIREGESLVILPISGVKHTVVAGDTLESIAKKYKGDLQEIIEYNHFDPDAKLAVGDMVLVPDGEAPAAPRRAGSSPAIRGSGPALDGYYQRPIAGGRKTQGLHGYNAVDLASSSGSPIFAAAAGRVLISRNGGWNGGYGNYIVIEHPNGTQTLYAHNSQNTVSVGQTVSQGQVIGHIGSTGKSTGPHLHFEVRGAKNPF